jgi:hypothetical protein
LPSFMKSQRIRINWLTSSTDLPHPFASVSGDFSGTPKRTRQTVGFPAE